MKYLYGAAVQGIQNFIFQTNKLKEIIGASELVEEICTSKFKQMFEQTGNTYVESQCILHAAGNLKYIFDNKEECASIVRIFPKTVQEFAPGITLSQAVVEMSGEFEKFESAVDELENRLRAQRNKPMRSSTLGLMGVERSRQTGLPVVSYDGSNHIDAGTRAKLYVDSGNQSKRTTLSLCRRAFGMSDISDGQIAYDIENITQKNDWVAIIHADGNGLGRIVQAIGKNQTDFKDFSEKLDAATTAAAVDAFKFVKDRFNDTRIPIRPIVLGGDDLTVICRADIALDYVSCFIKSFETQTKFVKNYPNLGYDKLSACAGIAYIKSSFPFYYGYSLAETLCTQAKKDAKHYLADRELPKSCLMFHKVQDSFTQDWDDIVERELHPSDNVSFMFGPYYINEKKNGNRWLVDELMDLAQKLDGADGNVTKSHLRQWISLLYDNPEMAKQKMRRVLSITRMKNVVEKATTGVERRENSVVTTTYPVYDLLVVNTINNQITKEDAQ